MVYVTGDCHGNFLRFYEDWFPDQQFLTRDDTVIVLGDFGLWHNTKSERRNLDWLASRPFTLVWVDGNHENFDRLYSDEFPTVDFRGGKAHRIRENVYHLQRGQVFEFDGKRFFAFGGARSHDIWDGIVEPDDFENEELLQKHLAALDKDGCVYRVNHRSWWSQEMPSEQEMEIGLQTISKYDNQVDFIISHCCPQEVASILGFYERDPLTTYFHEIADKASFRRWFFGHYHTEQTVLGKYEVLYRSIRRIL